MTTENVPMRDALLLNGIFESPRNVVLADDLGETLGTIFARQNLVGHDRKLLLYAANASSFSQPLRVSLDVCAVFDSQFV
jgi:hypothetical protein